jgi:hypothetical protein
VRVVVRAISPASVEAKRAADRLPTVIRMESMTEFGRLSGAAGLEEVLAVVEAYHFAPLHEVCSPCLTLSMPSNAHDAAGVVGVPLSVSPINLLACRPKIFPAVVAGIAVDVVDAPWDASCHVEEGEAMEPMCAIVQIDYENSVIPVMLNGPSNIASGPADSSLSVGKVTSARAIVEKLFKSCFTDFSHCLDSFKALVRGLPVGAGSSRHYIGVIHA